MPKPTKSRSEELARIKKKEEKRFIQAKRDARKERELKISNLKALRLEEEAKKEKVAKKVEKVATKKTKE